MLTPLQAILSQFAKSKKPVSNDESNNADCFAELKEDKELDEEEIEDTKELDADREASDAADIKGLAQGVDGVLELSHDDINLGCFMVTKVCYLLLNATHYTHSHSCSLQNLQSASFIHQSSTRT